MGNNIPNTLKIEKDDGLEVKVFDAQGVEHDITDAFRSIVGSTTPAAFTNAIELQSANTKVTIDFQAISKSMVFGIDTSVVNQLVALENTRLAGGIISVISQHLCELGAETEECFNGEPETLVLGEDTLNAQVKAIVIEGEVKSLDLGAGWVDTAYIEIGVRPKATMNKRNAGIFLIALNSPTKTQVHLQDFTGGGRSGGVIEIPKNSDFQYKITLTPDDSIGGTAELEVWVGGESQGTATLPYGYASTWEENVEGALDEDFSLARLFYSIIADRRGVGGVTYTAEVGEVVARAD